jgi:hypothetical protein
MNRRLAVSLALAFLSFLLAPRSHADTFPTPNGDGTFVIPDGSVITDEFFTPPGTTLTGFYTVDWTFADGSGTERTDSNDGGWGSITFTTPVSDLVFDWVGGGIFVANADDGEAFSCYSCGQDSGVATFTGPDITSITFQGFSGIGGIDSMTYTLDGPGAPVPEPGALLLLCVGLSACLAIRTRSKQFFGARRRPA